MIQGLKIRPNWNLFYWCGWDTAVCYTKLYRTILKWIKIRRNYKDENIAHKLYKNG